MQDDIHFPCVIPREEKLGVFQKRHTSSFLRTIDGDIARSSPIQFTINAPEEGAREPVRLALLSSDGPTGTFSNAAGSLPW
jgi:hypothetical protein